MIRFRLIRSTAFLFAFVLMLFCRPFPAKALTHQCNPDTSQPPGWFYCTAGLSNALFVVTAYDIQHAPEWCWAASGEMVMRYYGHPVSQQQIVGAIYGYAPDGTTPNWPAAQPAIDDLLNNQWTDNNNVQFTVTSVDVWSHDLTAAVAAFDAGAPIYVTTGHHAMVLTGFSYETDPVGNNFVLYARVQDPWPAGLGGHPGGSRVMNGTEFATLITAQAVYITP